MLLWRWDVKEPLNCVLKEEANSWELQSTVPHSLSSLSEYPQRRDLQPSHPTLWNWAEWRVCILGSFLPAGDPVAFIPQPLVHAVFLYLLTPTPGLTHLFHTHPASSALQHSQVGAHYWNCTRKLGLRIQRVPPFRQWRTRAMAMHWRSV